ncbi:MAG: AAA family ATPase [Candidatus Parabeggiatoa sp.]|nr:AAA family ATPase [Candidatus Parabeggiatoa sp.]
MNNPLFITDITLNKIRHLKEIDIALSKAEKKHLILTGKNGSGKTSVLEAIRDLLGNDNNTPQIPVISNHSLAIEFNALNDLTLLQENDFILSFFAAKRATSMDIPEGPKKMRLEKRYQIDTEPSHTFLQYLVNLKVEQSFARDDDDLETVEQIKTWFETFEAMLQALFADNRLTLQFDRKNYNFDLITQNRERFDFNTLADGYSAIVSIISDLIIRMAKQDGYEMPGIVLIDEIETHLHVELQKQILPFLTHFFPNIQFIVSTHSPFVLTSLQGAVIYDLENHLRVEDLSAYAYDAVIERYFEVDKYSDVIKDKVKAYEMLLKKENKTSDEQFQVLALKNELKKVPSDFAPELVAHFQSLELKFKND